MRYVWVVYFVQSDVDLGWIVDPVGDRVKVTEDSACG
jgi:hypothetical protein